MNYKKINMSCDKQLQEIIEQLRKAIDREDKKQINTLYEAAMQLDLDSVDEAVFQEYNELIDQANEILYT